MTYTPEQPGRRAGNYRVGRWTLLIFGSVCLVFLIFPIWPFGSGRTAGSAWAAEPARSAAGTDTGAGTGAAAAAGQAAVPYLFINGGEAPAGNLESRFEAPPGSGRVELPAASYGAWLRRLPVFPAGAPVRLYSGELKPRQDVHAAVVLLDVGKRDLQQCADAVMRLRAEYLLARGKPELIRFHPEPGRPTALTYSGHTREAFMRYLTRVFSEAGSASLQAELAPVRGPVQPGDVLIQGGHPGHAVQVLDVATGGGKRYLLLGQSFMPAQQLHVLKNLGAPGLSPWFDEAALDGPPGLLTPEWWPFTRKDVRRFPALPGVD